MYYLYLSKYNSYLYDAGFDNKIEKPFFIFRYALTVSYFTFDVLGILLTLCMLSHLIL